MCLIDYCTVVLCIGPRCTGVKVSPNNTAGTLCSSVLSEYSVSLSRVLSWSCHVILPAVLQPQLGSYVSSLSLVCLCYCHPCQSIYLLASFPHDMPIAPKLLLSCFAVQFLSTDRSSFFSLPSLFLSVVLTNFQFLLLLC